MMVSDAVTKLLPVITVCVCTYRRPGMLKQLLHHLDRQDTRGLFQYSVAVVDNDAQQSARTIVESWAERASIPIAYGVEPRQSIALARNASVRMAAGDFVAFVDDDEEPTSEWLRRLYEVLIESAADGVLGPVLPRFEEGAPNWAVKGQMFQRPAFETGEVINWRATATNNALVKREVLMELDGPFRSQFAAGGEDQDLFRRAMSQGRVFVWSADAVCHEPVPSERTRVTFQLRRALLRGKLALHGPEGSRRGLLKSAIAVPLYAVALPVCLVMGSHVFVSYLVKTCDHLGKLLAVCGIDLVGDRYIS
jgi:succinoglycan biosynthesis protein ExoM